MAATFDAATQAVGSTSSNTFAHTCTGTDRALLVLIGFWNGSVRTISTVTYAGVGMTLVVLGPNSAGNDRTAIYRLEAPASGANNVIVTFDASAQHVIVAISATNADQTNCVRGSASASGAAGTSPTLNIASDADDLVADVEIQDDDAGEEHVPGAGQTQRPSSTDGVGGGERGAASTEPGAATVTMSWTISGGAADAWSQSAASIKGAAGAGAAPPQRTLVGAGT